MIKLPEPVRRFLLYRAQKRMQREPNKIIGHRYMRRWHVIPRNPLFNVYLHAFRGSDDDRALHDHPWASCSIILSRYYLEHVPADPSKPAGKTRVLLRDTGQVTMRRAHSAHRIQVVCVPFMPPVVTLFITGPRLREWGFWCKHGWRHWREFTDPRDSGQTGRGCD